jgi:hypothetical protein
MCVAWAPSSAPPIVPESLETDTYRDGGDHYYLAPSALTTLDIRHLRTLIVFSATPLHPLLQAAGRTPQSVRLLFPHGAYTCHFRPLRILQLLMDAQLWTPIPVFWKATPVCATSTSRNT